MAAHPNGRRRFHSAGTEGAHRADVPRRAPLAEVAAAPDIASDTAWRLLYQQLFDFAPDAHVVTDTAGVIRTANHSAISLLHTCKDFVLDKPLALFVARCDWAVYYNWLLHIRAGKANAMIDRPLRVQPVQGPMRSMMVHVAACTDGYGAGKMLRWQLRPLSDSEELERTLRHERHFIDCVLETAQTLVLVLNAHGRILRANAAVATLLGVDNSDLDGRDWRRLFAPDHHAALERAMVHALAEEKPQRISGPLALADGTHRIVSWGIKSLALEPTSPVVLLAVGHDITELEDAQRQALQAERLAAIGQVTAVLAHEARNLLQRIQGGLDRLSWRLQDRPEALDVLTRVQAAQRDMTYLFENVRSFAAPLKLDVGLHDVAEVWREAWQHVLASTPDKRAELLEQIDVARPVCMVDRFRMEQVFRNIFENALAAAPEPVQVTVTCRATEIDHRPALLIACRDNGPGLTPQQRTQIFEPFYTTKPRGTGLGMAIAKRIVEAHDGTIAIGTRPGGAEILIALPRSPSR